jgi:hypothetical protein
MSDANTIDETSVSGSLPVPHNDGVGSITEEGPGTGAAETAPGSEHASVSLWGLAQQAMSFPVLLGALFVGVLSFALRGFKVDPDLWWHLRTGELILSTHKWPTTDSYSYTSFGAPWISCEWLGDVLFATIYRLKGLQGLQALHIAMASAVVLALYGFATLRSRNSKAGFVAAAVLLPITWVPFNLRPQMLGYFFLVLTLAVLERFRQGKQGSIWLLPPLFLIWINTHGSWVVGLGVVVVYIVCGLFDFQGGSIEAQGWTSSQRLQLETVLMLSLATIPITPYGTELAAYPFKVSSKYPIAIASVSEWLPLPFNSQEGKFFLVVLLGFFLLQMILRFRWHLAEALLLFGGIGMACLHRRFMILFVAFFIPFVAIVNGRWISSYNKAKDKYVINVALVIAILAGAVRYFPSNEELRERVAKQFPVGGLEYMRKHPVPGLLFNDYRFGGYLVGSGFETFVDGRTEMFEEVGVFHDYMQITTLQPGALKVLEAYHIRACLLQPDEPLAVVLASFPNWERVYSDDVSALFVNRDGAPPVGFSEAAVSNALIPQDNNLHVQGR